MQFTSWLDSLTVWAEFGKSGGIAPANGPSGRPKLERIDGGHVITKDGFSELDSVRRQEGIQRASILVETLGVFLYDNGH